MSKIKYLIIHCTDTPAKRKVSRVDIEQWHIVERGWKKVGYSDMVHIDGSLENLIDWDQDGEVEGFEISNGARGYNSKSRHIVYVGGADNIDTRTPEQYETLKDYVRFVVKRYPWIGVIGHNEVSEKDCPSFDVGQFCEEIGVPFKNTGL